MTPRRRAFMDRAARTYRYAGVIHYRHASGGAWCAVLIDEDLDAALPATTPVTCLFCLQRWTVEEEYP